MANGSRRRKRTRAPAGEYISTSSTVRPAASSSCGQAFKAFEVTPPPQAFGSPGGRPSNKATRRPARAKRSAANEPAGPAPTISMSKFLSHAMFTSSSHERLFAQFTSSACILQYSTPTFMSRSHLAGRTLCYVKIHSSLENNFHRYHLSLTTRVCPLFLSFLCFQFSDRRQPQL